MNTLSQNVSGLEGMKKRKVAKILFWAAEILFVFLSIATLFLLLYINPLASPKNVTYSTIVWFSSLTGFTFLVIWQKVQEMLRQDAASPSPVFGGKKEDWTFFWLMNAALLWAIASFLFLCMELNVFAFPQQFKYIIASITSSLNTIFFLLAILDFDYREGPPAILQRPLIKWFTVPRNIWRIGFVVIIISVILFIYGFGVYGFLPDIIFSGLSLIILCVGLNQLFNERGFNRWLVYITIILTFSAQFTVLFPQSTSPVIDLLGLIYKIALISLFLVLGFSFIFSLGKQRTGEVIALSDENSHTVYNQLTAINSIILGIQDRPEVDKDQALEKIRVIVNLFGELHRQLYTSHDGELEMSLYLKEITRLLSECLGFSEENFILKDNLSYDVSIAASKAQKIGRIVTELVMNMNKHAYTGQTYKWVEVSLEMEKEDGKKFLVCTVADRGKGLPGSFETLWNSIDCDSGLGWSVIKGHIDLLNAEITIDKNHSPGVKFVVKIPL